MVFWVFYLLAMCVCFMQKIGKEMIKTMETPEKVNLEQGKVTPLSPVWKKVLEMAVARAEAFGFTEDRVIYEQVGPILLG